MARLSHEGRPAGPHWATAAPTVGHHHRRHGTTINPRFITIPSSPPPHATYIQRLAAGLTRLPNLGTGRVATPVGSSTQTPRTIVHPYLPGGASAHAHLIALGPTTALITINGSLIGSAVFAFSPCVTLCHHISPQICPSPSTDLERYLIHLYLCPSDHHLK